MCQIVKKISNVKKSNSWTWKEIHKKINTMRLTNNDVNFDITYEGDEDWSKIFLSTIWDFSMNIKLLLLNVWMCEDKIPNDDLKAARRLTGVNYLSVIFKEAFLYIIPYQQLA